MMKAWIQRYARWIACVGIGCVCMVLGFVLGGVWSSRQAAAGVTVPILTPAANMLDALERFRSEREQERKQDRASLEKLIDAAAVEEQTRQDAAEALTRLVEWNQQELALEGALKMKEISYIHAEAYAAGELKHGTIALIDEGQPVIALCCNSHIAEKTMNNIVEVKARGAQVLALALKGNRAILAQADDVIYIPALDPLFQPLVEIIPLQLLAYYVAKENGCDIDKPKNLAKSVTVE